MGVAGTFPTLVALLPIASSPAAGRAYDITPPPVPDKPTVAKQGSAVLVSWVLPYDKDVEQMGIWRREEDGAYVMIAPAFDKSACTNSNCSFLDQTVQPGIMYFYEIQVFDGSGNNAFSPESNGILIQF